MGKVIRNESGTVLVIALMMMVVLTLIVLTATSTAIFETKLSGHKRSSTAAFYAADGGVQATTANISNFILEEKYVDNRYDPSDDPMNTNPTKARVLIEHDPIQEGAPRGTGISAINFGFEHFVVASTGGDDSESGGSKSSCTIEEKVVRLVPTEQGGY